MFSKTPRVLFDSTRARWHSCGCSCGSQPARKPQIPRFPAARSIFPDEELDFDPETPLIIRGRFNDIPAIGKWFEKPPAAVDAEKKSSTVKLNLPYLNQHGSTHAPLELTRRDGASTSFQRFSAPISLLLAHITEQNPQDESLRLYLAQYSLADLPSELQNDVPTPKIISELGAGDIYGSSLWMGLPPTRTPLHRDPNPNLFIQLAGTKRIRLMQPERGRALYEKTKAGSGRANMRGEEMMAGEESDKLEDAVWNDSGKEGGVEGVEAQLHSGDGLYIPLGWWHAVRGLGAGPNASVSVLIDLQLI